MSLIPVTTRKLPVLGETPASPFDVSRVREDFPILKQQVHGKPLVYLDNAATTQKPQAVLDAIARYYETTNANVHRGVHYLSEKATEEYEGARTKVQHFLHAASAREIVFTRGTTEGVNLVAQSYGRKHFRPGDEVIVSYMEHHSNIVPWQLVCEQTGAVLKVVPIDDAGEFLFEEYEKLLGPRTKFVSVVHLSNCLGTINPVRQIIELAHQRGVPVLLDGAQAASHLHVDVQDLDCDFYALSGHKLYGPTGIGVLYGKESLLAEMPPYQGGGDMIRSVSFAKTTYNTLPHKFEAGTPHIEGAVGLAAALDYVTEVGLDAIAAHEQELLEQATAAVSEIRGVRILGTAREKAAVLSFVVEDPPLSALDVGTRLDLEGIAVRTGHHCCQPVMDRFGVPATTRASLGMYNTAAEIDRFVGVLRDLLAEAGSRSKASVPAMPNGRAEPSYPGAAADSPQAAAEELAEVFEFLEDWPDRYQYLIELGEKLPPMPDELKTDENRVRGCQSTVFLAARQKPGTADVVEFLADSDAHIVRGELGLLQHLFSGQKARDILAFDVAGFFAKLGLDQHLSPTRRNGLANMVKRLRGFAATFATPPRHTASTE